MTPASRALAAASVLALCAPPLLPALAAGPPELAAHHPAPPPPPPPAPPPSPAPAPAPAPAAPPPPHPAESPYSAQNIGNPYSTYNLQHPESPTSGLNISNPANPASPNNPNNPSNPANPNSPLNPSNQPYSGENIANPYSTYNLQHPESPYSALNINNPNNIASPNNPANIQRRRAKQEEAARPRRDEGPGDEGPRYRSGFLSAFEGDNPVVVYRRGAAEAECRIGVDCPRSVYAALGRPAPAGAQDDAPRAPSGRHAKRRHRAAED